MNEKDNNPVEKASQNPIKEAKGHPDGPDLEEMINGKEEKVLKGDKKGKSQSGETDDARIPVI